jgi:hypothetical protein
MKDTVAIVGSHPDTSKQFDFDRTDCDIWVFNEALATDWCKRADGVFQMHKPVIFRSATNRNDPKHYEWLKTQQDCVVFMIDQYEDVPKSEKYPLMEIFEAFPNAERYFTSSVAYAIALAVYKGYKVIEVYGVEMETQTEYGPQRTGVAYWVGFAAGKGICVNFHSRKFFSAPLYGYDGDIQIPIEYFEQRIEHLNQFVLGSKGQFENVRMMIEDQLDDFVTTYKTNLEDLDVRITAAGQNSYNLGMTEAALNLNKMYLDKSQKMIEETGEYLIVRQEYEGYKLSGMKNMQKAQAMTNRTSDVLTKLRPSLNTNENKAVREKLVKDFSGALANFLHASHEFGKVQGVVRESLVLLKEYDTYLRASGINTKGEAEAVAQPEMVEVPA